MFDQLHHRCSATVLLSQPGPNAGLLA